MSEESSEFDAQIVRKNQEVRESKPRVYYERCDVCNRTFAGFTKHQAEAQLQVHKISKHGLQQSV
jgi:hypothetical protein